MSRLIVRGIEAAAAQRADLASRLQQPGTFLDVGAGVGWLAIEAAQSWPALHVVGVDSWQPALDLARKNLAQSSVAERVEFRSQRIEELTDEAVFALAWLPAFSPMPPVLFVLGRRAAGVPMSSGVKT